MWKTAFALSFLAFGMALGGCDAETQADFKVCESTYALCTTAACTPIAGETDTVSCACEVKTGYSAGEQRQSRDRQRHASQLPLLSDQELRGLRQRPAVGLVPRQAVYRRQERSDQGQLRLYRDQGPGTRARIWW